MLDYMMVLLLRKTNYERFLASFGQRVRRLLNLIALDADKNFIHQLLRLFEY